MILSSSITFVLILSIIGVFSMLFAASITILDVKKLQDLERKIKNKSNIINDRDYQYLEDLKSQLIQLRNQFVKLNSQGQRRLIYENEALIQEVQQNIEVYVNVEAAIKKKLSELLRQESDLGKIDYMIKILKLLLHKN